MIGSNLESKKNKSAYRASIGFLIIVILATTTLHLYNNVVLGKINKVQFDINSIEKSIINVQKDKKIQIYSLLELNKSTISGFEKMNKIIKYMNHMNVIKSKYDLELKGFNLSDGKLQTNATFTSDKKALAYVKVKDFIKKYRNDTKALFDLEFISGIEGMDEMKFKINFKIK